MVPVMPPDPALPFDPVREESELREYLGGSYDHERLQRYQEQLDSEFESGGDEAAFYRSSQAYLYNLTAFAMTGTKLPYLTELTERVSSGSRLLDYGCGIGSDGLILLEAGYQVEFADFDNPSIAYLRWRLAKRGVEAPVYDLDKGVPSGFDGAYAFDVIEHVEDPFGFLSEMERRAGLVVVNVLEPEPGDQSLHHELPVSDLVRHATRKRLVGYRILHERSHLLMYEPEAGDPIRRALGIAQVARQRSRRGVERALETTRRATKRVLQSATGRRAWRRAS